MIERQKTFEKHEKIGKNTENRKVNLRCIHNLDFTNFSENLELSDSVRVLKIINCKSIESIAVNIKFVKSSNLFVIVVEVEAIADDFDINAIDLSSFYSDGRPLIFQIAVKNEKPSIYFKEENQTNFDKIKEMLEIEVEDLVVHIMTGENGCNLQNLLNLFGSNHWHQKFNGDLMSLKAEVSSFTYFHGIVNTAARENVLCFRLLQLLLGDSEKLSDFVSITESLEYKGIGTLLTLLELHFGYASTTAVNLTKNQKKNVTRS